MGLNRAFTVFEISASNGWKQYQMIIKLLILDPLMHLASVVNETARPITPVIIYLRANMLICHKQKFNERKHQKHRVKVMEKSATLCRKVITFNVASLRKSERDLFPAGATDVYHQLTAATRFP